MGSYNYKNKIAEALMSGAQGASNSVAGMVSGPVDIISVLLRAGGVPVPQNAIGSSDWMNDNGLMAEPKNKIAGLLGEGLGGAAPSIIASKAPQIASGLLQMGQNAMAHTPFNNLTRGQGGATNFNYSKLETTEQARKAIQSDAEEFAAKLNVMGFDAKVTHSGSVAGPSSYVKVFYPETGRYFRNDVRFSNHSKGAFNSQMVSDVVSQSEFDRLINLAKSMREQGPSDAWMAMKNNKTKEFMDRTELVSNIRKSVQQANKDAIKSELPFEKAFSNTGKYLR